MPVPKHRLLFPLLGRATCFVTVLAPSFLSSRLPLALTVAIASSSRHRPPSPRLRQSPILRWSLVHFAQHPPLSPGHGLSRQLFNKRFVNTHACIGSDCRRLFIWSCAISPVLDCVQRRRMAWLRKLAPHTIQQPVLPPAPTLHSALPQPPAGASSAHRVLARRHTPINSDIQAVRWQHFHDGTFLDAPIS